MAYHERGRGTPILFLHGNPTSSYIWRDVVPSLEGLGHIIVPDLIGMGDSAKIRPTSTDTYCLATHREYLWAFMEAVTGLNRRVILVGHDWGAVLGFDWANHHRDRVQGFVYMETIVRNFRATDSGSELRPTFMALRSEEGEDLILKQNLFVEELLPKLIIRTLSDFEMAEYRKPFLREQDRWPTLTWPRQIPIAGEPADVVATIDGYSRWMESNEIPKLFVNAEPGAILTGAPREFCRAWRNQTEVTVPGRHFLQEDSAEMIGNAIVTWIQEHNI